MFIVIIPRFFCKCLSGYLRHFLQILSGYFRVLSDRTPERREERRNVSDRKPKTPKLLTIPGFQQISALIRSRVGLEPVSPLRHVMLQSVKRGCVRHFSRSTRYTMIKAAPVTSKNIFVFNPRLRQNSRSVKMKNNGGIGVYLPPMRRLMSVTASVHGNLKTERSVDDWFQMIQSSSFARYAYNEYSDENSDRDDDMSAPKQVLFTTVCTLTQSLSFSKFRYF